MRTRIHLFLGLMLVTICLGFLMISLTDSDPYQGWETYGGTKDAARYSSLTQIDTTTVSRLQVAWTYHTRDASERSQIQCQPIVANQLLYATSAQLSVFALDPATGTERWRFDTFRWLGADASGAGVNRGVTYWTDGTDKRILFSAGSWLICLDADTGKPVGSFGDGGKVDLHKDLDYDKADFSIVSTTPGIVYRDLLILGMRLSEGLGAAPGHVRAYNIRTGKRAWIFHTIPHPGEFGADTWPANEAWKRHGGANNWSGMCLDERRGIVYVPTGSATADFYGADRPGANLFANSLLALDAVTGKRHWHFQFIHHDLWDRDLPANPNLVTITRNGVRIDAVAQVTKYGFVYVFDRATGEPIFPVRETPVPTKGLPGEPVWPTQPLPTLPQPFTRQRFTESDLIDISPAHCQEVLKRFKPLLAGSPFIPPSVQGSVLFPGFDGGAEWGGASVDPQTGILYVNANEIPWLLKMAATEPATHNDVWKVGRALYATNCANCHGLDRQGNSGAFPNLLHLNRRRTPNYVATTLRNGRGAMPSFRYLSEADRQALMSFLLELSPSAGNGREMVETKALPLQPYTFTGYDRFLTKEGYPAIKPPWGTLNAIDLNTGKRLWQVPLGEYPELTKRGIPKTGTENYGGAVVTAGGLLFIGASKDSYFRAFNKRTGQEIWSYKLPAAAFATPATYQIAGKQYLVVACGGGKSGTPSGDAYVAFALP